MFLRPRKVGDKDKLLNRNEGGKCSLTVSYSASAGSLNLFIKEYQPTPELLVVPDKCVPPLTASMDSHSFVELARIVLAIVDEVLTHSLRDTCICTG